MTVQAPALTVAFTTLRITKVQGPALMKVQGPALMRYRPCPSRSKILLKSTSPISVAVCLKEGKRWNLTLAVTTLLLDHHAMNIQSSKSLALVAFPPLFGT